MVELNERQQRFVDEYIKSGVAYSAALAAGYSEKYAKTDSHKLLENTRIKAAIGTQMEVLKTSTIADQQEILQLLTDIARGKATGTSLVGIGGGAQSVEQLPPSLSERTKAAELLGKRYAMWTDKQQVENITPVFVKDVPEDDD